MKVPISHPWPVRAHCDYCGQSLDTLLARTASALRASGQCCTIMHLQVGVVRLAAALCIGNVPPVFGHQTTHYYSPSDHPDLRCLVIRLWIMLFTLNAPPLYNFLAPNFLSSTIEAFKKFPQE